jgi:trehalose synthase
MTIPQSRAGPLTEVDVGLMSLERFDGVLDPAQYEEVRQAIVRAQRVLGGRTVWNVNSTACGGGVAELLTTLMAYARGAGVDARWMVISGDKGFFEITKRIHNRLHGFVGDGGPLGEAERARYEAALAPNAEALAALLRPGDAVILHDPQTAGLIPAVRARGVPVIWRCHVGVDVPGELSRETWRYLGQYVGQADVTVFSREAFAWDIVGGSRHVIIRPTIDAFAPKNQELEPATVEAILAAARVRAPASLRAAPDFTRMDGSPGRVKRAAHTVEEAPLRPDDSYVLQVSRWDALKDPLGVIEGFAERVAQASDAHLVYAGPAVEAVTDDPEGLAVLEQATELWRGLEPGVRERVHLAMLPMDDPQENAAIVNALQRGADVVVQKSIAEGFGLTVAEAMWKARPVTASRIGGIQDQIEDGHNGVLLDDPCDRAAFGAAVLRLLSDKPAAEAMGAAARESVRERFLGPHSLLAYLELLGRLL